MHEYGVDADVRGTTLPRAARDRRAVAHREFKRTPDRRLRRASSSRGGVYIDVKCQADAAALRARGVTVWRL